MPIARFTDFGVRKLPLPKKSQIVHTERMIKGLSLLLVVSYGGSKSWRAQFYVKGRRQTKPIGQYPKVSVAKARARALEILADVNAPPSPVVEGQTTEKAKTFGDVAYEFIVRYVQKRGLLSQAEIRRLFNICILPQWAERPIDKIRRSDVTALLDRIEDNHGATTADRVLALIGKLFNWYATRVNDFSSPIVKGMKRTDPSETKRERKLTDDEIRALWAASAEMGSYGALLRTLLFTGQRLSPVKHMKWSQIDVDGVWNIPVTSPRAKKHARQLKLPQLAFDVINPQLKIKGNPHVFPASTGPGPINAFSKRKNEIDEKLPLSMTVGDRWVLHDLRRTAKSLMARAGVLPHVSERVLGHTIKGVEGVYDQHSYADEKADALDKLARLVEIILNPAPDATNVVELRGRKKL